MDNPEINEMAPYEKEEVFAEEIEKLINRFCQEYNMTYAQVIGVLHIQIALLTKEGFMEDEEEEEDEP